ncbi:F-box protein [Streptomyces sp. NPDC057910]|uniref:F-box protein n=1 Tax=Streptomyces sp. NPDC057910 TaxID=3346278 RepID=UPI0036E28723
MTEPVGSEGAGAEEVWAFLAPAVWGDDGIRGLLARAYQAFQSESWHDLPNYTWEEIAKVLFTKDQASLAQDTPTLPDASQRWLVKLMDPAAFPEDMWREILQRLPLEDQARLGQVDHRWHDLVTRLSPTTVRPDTRPAQGFVRTIYTQNELDASLNAAVNAACNSALTDPTCELIFTPGAGSDLTIGLSHGQAEVHGPEPLAAVTAGSVHAVGVAHIIRVADGYVGAFQRAAIDTVTGGEVHAYWQSSINTMTGGTASLHDEATICSMTGGTVHASEQAAIGHVAGGTLTVIGNAAATAVGGDARITARDNAHVIIRVGAEGVIVDAYDAAVITADSGTVNVHGPSPTVINNGEAVVRRV